MSVPVIEQRSPEWHEMRNTLLTASDLGQCIGKGKFGTRDDLVRKKADSSQANVFNANLAPLKWGTRYEPVALRCYRARNKWVKVHEFGLIKHPTFSIFGASPDGITELGIMVELKCPYKRVKIDGHIPDQYGYQIQGQLEVCDLEDCDYVECYLEEFRSANEYTACPAEVLGRDHGAVLEFTIEGKGVNGWGQSTAVEFIYSPPEAATAQDVVSWVHETAEDVHNQKPQLHITRVYYWRLKDIQTIRVTRDRKMFEDVKPEIVNFWDQVMSCRGDPSLLPRKQEKQGKRTLSLAIPNNETKTPTKFLFKKDCDD